MHSAERNSQLEHEINRYKTTIAWEDLEVPQKDLVISNLRQKLELNENEMANLINKLNAQVKIKIECLLLLIVFKITFCSLKEN